MSHHSLVTLSTAEVYHAALVGVTRQTTNLRDRRQDAHGAQQDMGWQYHIEGACGEKAFAKFYGLYWSGAIGDLRADDVGQFQVRTNSRSNGDLILHPNDVNDRIFVPQNALRPIADIQLVALNAQRRA